MNEHSRRIEWWYRLKLFLVLLKWVNHWHAIKLIKLIMSWKPYLSLYACVCIWIRCEEDTYESRRSRRLFPDDLVSDSSEIVHISILSQILPIPYIYFMSDAGGWLLLLLFLCYCFAHIGVITSKRPWIIETDGIKWYLYFMGIFALLCVSNKRLLSTFNVK